MVDYQATRPIQHGGNQAAIRARLRLGNRPLLDFSAPLNAMGPPPGDLIALIGQASRDPLGRRARELGDPNLPMAHLSEPTYGEYRRTSAQNGLNTKVWGEHILGWLQDDEPEGAAGLFWTGHPNNPTGRAWDRPRLLALIDRNPDLISVVDEAYLPFLPDEAERTLVNEAAARDNLIVLRSMTKIYAFPGLRIGYAVASSEMIRKLRRQQQPWTVTTAAEAAAMAAVDDEAYLGRTIDLIATESARLTDRLWDLPGLRPAWPGRERPRSAPSMPNFVLVSLVDTPWDSLQLQEALARRGLFARECSNYRGLEIGATVTGPGRSFPTNGHLRFCVRTPAQNDLLLETLSNIMSERPPA
jgi:threonine-phosphate decarboxylase